LESTAYRRDRCRHGNQLLRLRRPLIAEPVKPGDTLPGGHEGRRPEGRRQRRLPLIERGSVSPGTRRCCDKGCLVPPELTRRLSCWPNCRIAVRSPAPLLQSGEPQARRGRAPRTRLTPRTPLQRPDHLGHVARADRGRGFRRRRAEAYPVELPGLCGRRTATASRTSWPHMPKRPASPPRCPRSGGARLTGIDRGGCYRAMQRARIRSARCRPTAT